MAKMNANIFITKDYENEPLSGPKKQTQNKPNSNPIKACPERIEFTLSVIEGNGPISEKPKMTVNLYVIEDYENETAFRPKKKNPKQTQSCPP